MFLSPPNEQHNTMMMRSTVFLVTTSLVFPLVLTSPVLVEQNSLVGCQCSPELTTKVGLTAGGQLVMLVDIAG